MYSKDKFNTTTKITQLEIRCFYHNTKNYFEIIENTIKDNKLNNKNIYMYIIKQIILITKCLKISSYINIINRDNTPQQEQHLS